MRRALQIAIVLGPLMLLIDGLSAQTKLLDQVVAVVDRDVITLDQWQQQERFEALMMGRDPNKVALTEASLDRLIDRALIDKNRTSISFAAVTSSEVERQLAVVRKQLVAEDTDAAWRGLLARY